jgi:hypothetical protein
MRWALVAVAVLGVGCLPVAAALDLGPADDAVDEACAAVAGLPASAPSAALEDVGLCVSAIDPPAPAPTEPEPREAEEGAETASPAPASNVVEDIESAVAHVAEDPLSAPSQAPGLVEQFQSWIETDLLGAVASAFGGAVEGLAEAVTGAGDGVASIVRDLGSAGESLAGGAGQAASGVADALAGVAEGVTAGLGDVARGLGDAVSSILGSGPGSSSGRSRGPLPSMSERVPAPARDLLAPLEDLLGS